MLIERLGLVIEELSDQRDVGKLFPETEQSLDAQIEQIREWLEDANEFGLAYESVVILLERFPFLISGRAVVALLEVGLLLKFKTDRASDTVFDSRKSIVS